MEARVAQMVGLLAVVPAVAITSSATYYYFLLGHRWLLFITIGDFIDTAGALLPYLAFTLVWSGILEIYLRWRRAKRQVDEPVADEPGPPVKARSKWWRLVWVLAFILPSMFGGGPIIWFGIWLLWSANARDIASFGLSFIAPGAGHSESLQRASYAVVILFGLIVISSIYFANQLKDDLVAFDASGSSCEREICVDGWYLVDRVSDGTLVYRDSQLRFIPATGGLEVVAAFYPGPDKPIGCYVTPLCNLDDYRVHGLDHEWITHKGRPRA